MDMGDLCNHNEDFLNIEFNRDQKEIESYNESTSIQIKDITDPKKMRLRFLSKLAKEQIWLPPIKQPKINENLIILDWDDTLFPTSHLNPIDESQYDHLAEKYKKFLAEVED